MNDNELNEIIKKYDKKIDRLLEIMAGDDNEHSDKTAFLDELFEEYDIGYVTTNPRTFFSKLIKLYGEEFLANYRYIRYGQNKDERGNLYTYVVNQYSIQDFLGGRKDLLDLVTNDKLKNVILGRATQPTLLKDEKTYDLFGSKFTEKQIIEGINEDAFYYWDIIDIIRKNETIRDMVLRKITSLDITSEEYADYSKLLDEIHHIRANELQSREAELSELENEEKTISEAEALIDKQTEKEGQNIGE